ncbi:hypothetical protein LSTR_LSTR006828 [Laodelphax striatellus]|uniref:Lipase domain-containing protein n=1 Tax=Laodelphax striatellus TaxID=195883 RepID=A0A482XG65_LAOST|nr:hypothetical protein LSTR_LSTR006828 [Laodelphax striatellus]
MLELFSVLLFISHHFAYAEYNELALDTSAEFIEDFYLKDLRRQLMTDEDTVLERCLSIYDPGEWVQFMLYTRESATVYEELFLGNLTSIEDSKFDKTKETKIVVHGWLSKVHMRFTRDIRKAFLEAKDCNVISVDWPSMTEYTIARFSVGSVAAKLSQFLSFLINEAGVDPQSIHLLGHSLGAHISGIAGRSLQNVTLPRITGFDPSGVFFSSKPEYRIDASDADFVDIIHTCGHWLGYYDPIGHVDFYPNGGLPIQPGCGFDLGYCSHCRSYLLYIETITSDEPGFLAAKCDSNSDFNSGKCCSDITQMGENADRKARGIYFLYTGDQSPYGLGNQSIPAQCWDQADTIS